MVSNGDHDFERILLKLRRDGFRLIDLQREDTAFTTVWYRRGKSFLGLAAEDVPMLLWEMQDPERRRHSGNFEDGARGGL
ncbi:MAG: hypothetical protein HYX46_03390 [Betaproteobacteria bacterium]|nr:hypothetical protein [Betaproteobacteria bacterium]